MKSATDEEFTAYLAASAVRLRRMAYVPELAAAPPLPLEDRLAVREALARVLPRQRAVLVLRYYEDCDVAETARLVGCSEGTVKSQAARGLTRLRELLATADWSAVFTEG